MSPVQTRSRSSLVASSPMKEMAFLKHSTSLKKGRVNMAAPKISPSSSSSASSSSSPAAGAERKGGKMAYKSKELRVQMRGPDTIVCSPISISKGSGHESATAVHPSCGGGHVNNAESIAQSSVIKCSEDASGNGNRDACPAVVEASQDKPEPEEWWDEESCSTPKAAECRIPVDACLACPPAPRKRKAVARFTHTDSPFSTLPRRSGSPPLMILPQFIEAFFFSAEHGTF